jgi:hypothetical protein
MRTPLAWGLVALAVVATGLAIWAGPNLTFAVPAAATALIAAALLFVEIAARPTLATPRAEAPTRRSTPNDVRAALTSGRFGRERLVVLLDRLERAGPNPELGLLSVPELRSILAMSPREFRGYLDRRLAYLEANT